MLLADSQYAGSLCQCRQWQSLSFSLRDFSHTEHRFQCSHTSPVAAALSSCCSVQAGRVRLLQGVLRHGQDRSCSAMDNNVLCKHAVCVAATWRIALAVSART